jgi:hypothetical protein
MGVTRLHNLFLLVYELFATIEEAPELGTGLFRGRSAQNAW